MRIALQPEQEARLEQIASHRRMRRDELVRQILGCYPEENKAPLVQSAADDRGGLGTELSALFPKGGPDFVIESPFDLPQKAAGLRPADSRGRLSPHKSSRSRRKKRP